MENAVCICSKPIENAKDVVNCSNCMAEYHSDCAVKFDSISSEFCCISCHFINWNAFNTVTYFIFKPILLDTKDLSPADLIISKDFTYNTKNLQIENLSVNCFFFVFGGKGVSQVVDDEQTVIVKLNGKELEIKDKTTCLNSFLRQENRLELFSKKKQDIVLCCLLYESNTLRFEAVLDKTKKNKVEKMPEIRETGNPKKDFLFSYCKHFKTKLDIPARGSKCTHFSCFDLKGFLTFNKWMHQWSCPICSARLFAKDVIIDQRTIYEIKNYEKEGYNLERNYLYLKNGIIELGRSKEEEQKNNKEPERSYTLADFKKMIAENEETLSELSRSAQFKALTVADIQDIVEYLKAKPKILTPLFPLNNQYETTVELSNYTKKKFEQHRLLFKILASWGASSKSQVSVLSEFSLESFSFDNNFQEKPNMYKVLELILGLSYAVSKQEKSSQFAVLGEMVGSLSTLMELSSYQLLHVNYCLITLFPCLFIPSSDFETVNLMEAYFNNMVDYYAKQFEHLVPATVDIPEFFSLLFSPIETTEFALEEQHLVSVLDEQFFGKLFESFKFDSSMNLKIFTKIDPKGTFRNLLERKKRISLYKINK